MVVRGVLPTAYYRYYMLLVSAMQLRLQERIDDSTLDTFDFMLMDFVSRFPTLYGEANCRFNVHQLLHITENVRDWGPFWSFSTYSFESSYGQLGNLLHGTQYVHQQIAKILV